jgi:RNA polymerase sigma-70 factor (sigma-E family)
MLGLGRQAPRALGGSARRDAVITELCQEHWLGLVRLALLMVGDRPSAEDVVQESFTALYLKWDRLRDEAKALPYLRSTVLNGCRTVLRRRGVARRHSPPPEPPVWSAESDVLLGEDRREVLVALNELPTRRREVLVLRFYLNLSDREIARTLGITEITVRTTASRALAILGRRLEENR